jgi:hypothetical protein
MRDSQSYPAAGRYVITEQGRYDLHLSETCQCNPRLAGLLIECAKCGTIYGTLRDRLGEPVHNRDKRR